MKAKIFELKKLYLDCIDEKGNCFIIYWAKLEFSLLKISYSGLIFSNAQNITIETSSLKKISNPLVNNLLHFDNPSLQLKGSWERVDAPVSMLLYTDSKGKEIFWDCHHPKTITNISYNDKLFQGLGYAETLSISIKPWLLPIDELRWGRFLSEKITLIWINWKGKYPVNKVFYNGTVYEDAIFEEDSVSFDKGSAILLFLEKTIIRTGKLANILAKMPWLKIIFNHKILNTVEIKFKSKSSFSKDSIVITNGWSLFEIVTWTK